MSLSVIIPSKTASNLVPCIRAIRDAGESCRIIVVDDGIDWGEAFGRFEPTAEETAKRRAELAAVTVVPGTKPFIFSRAVNAGIMAGVSDVCILNDDALLRTPSGFTAMHRAAKEHPNFGIISSSCNNVGNLNQMPRGSVSTERSVIRDEPWTLCFVCVLIPRKVIDLVGPLDERFTGYGCEDQDFCVRVKNAGLALGIYDGCFVDHHSLQSSFRAPSPTNSSPGDFLPNLKLFIEKWGVDTHGRGCSESPYRDLFPPEGA
jgi:GT2 family glycosyltransferase